MVFFLYLTVPLCAAAYFDANFSLEPIKMGVKKLYLFFLYSIFNLIINLKTVVMLDLSMYSQLTALYLIIHSILF